MKVDLKQAVTLGLLGLLVGALPSTAHAHFKLIAPDSWVNEDSQGAPQKGGPCGPGGYDNVNPIPMSGKVTDFHAGETITLKWTDTIAHPGYFRIALAENRADFVNPTIMQDGNCNFADESKVPKTASGNVLADGVAFRSRMGFSDAAGKMFTQQVTLPDKPCDKCTLQVMQVMENDLQALSKCYYFHCADIRILPKDGTAGTGGGAGAGGGAGSGSAGVGGGGAGGSGETAGAGSAAGAGAAGVGGVGVAGFSGGAAGTNGVAGTQAIDFAGTSGGVAGVSGVVAGAGAVAGANGGSTTPKSSSCSVANLGAGSSSGSNQGLPALVLFAAVLGLRRRRSWS